jgi:HSP20 family protein
MMNVNNHLDRFFNGVFYSAGSHATQEDYRWNPAADVYENDDAYVIKAELPGLDKNHINVDVKKNILTIKGERSDNNEVKEDKVYRRERFQGKFQRAFVLPSAVESGKIAAEFTDGLLKITIPKSGEMKSKTITIH